MCVCVQDEQWAALVSPIIFGATFLTQRTKMPLRDSAVMASLRTGCVGYLLTVRSHAFMRVSHPTYLHNSITRVITTPRPQRHSHWRPGGSSKDPFPDDHRATSKRTIDRAREDPGRETQHGRDKDLERNAMSGRYAFAKSLRELRFLLCQTGEHSAAARCVQLSRLQPPLPIGFTFLARTWLTSLQRSFLTKSYPTMKHHNPTIPILVREALVGETWSKRPLFGLLQRC